ncbi:MAG TPA: NAD-dependent epimerase/dehydratase family protein [Actinomycetota bacterium]|nr:NAD-dependent epimerase/dehydratase family protein [Actinomycetota bacterium]
MKVLVTGGAGFIGSHIVDRLVAEGHDVAALDSLASGKRANLVGAMERGARLHEVDIRDRSIGTLLAEERPEVVMHLAAQIDVRVSVADPSLDADINVAGSLNVLTAAKEAGARKFIVASSGGCIYGEPKKLPVKETYRGTPDSPYGISKKVLHDYLGFFRNAHGLDFTVLALANVYGPRQDPTGEAGVVAIFLGAMLSGKQPVIYGDGKQTRDFVHVSDIVDAFARAIGRGSGTVFNIGTAVETNVLELWDACARAAGYSGEVKFAPARLGELERIALDFSRAKRKLDWTPRMSLDAGIADTAAWVREGLRA